MDTRKIAGGMAKTAALLALIFGLSYFMLFRSEPYRFAISFIKADPMIRDYVGPVKKVGMGLSGFSEGAANSSSGYAEFGINVVGETGKGVVHLNLKKASGAWSVKTGNLTLPDGRVIQLLPSSAEASE